MAQYGSAKLYEAATIPAHVAELEQFVHCEIFPVTQRSCVVITAPIGASYQRAVEVADGLKELGAISIGISDDPGFAEHCTHGIALPPGWDESFSPFLAAIPHQYFALYWALRLGENADLVSNKKVNRPLIERSAQWSMDDYAANIQATGVL
jgi:glucosamine 6-phosphate synthetase-like amidotransferase/phosphosugar isomerase protein